MIRPPARRAAVALRALLSGCFATACGASALALSDAKTGFGVNPPAPYVATASSHPTQDILFGINSTTGAPAIAGTSKNLCGAGFKASAANGKLSQKQINALVDDESWRATARATIGALMTIESEKVFEVAGARGVEYIATPKMGPNHENIAMMLNLIEAPQGRVSLTCALNRPEFQPALESLRAIRSTITLPK